MEISCPRCQSLHEIEPPASVRARGPRSLKFRCSHCGHTFTVDPAPLSNLEPAQSPTLPGPMAEPIQKVRFGGQEWSVPDGAALVRAILDGRIDREAQVSNHGLRWVRAGDREDLRIFFEAFDAVSFQQRNLRTEMPAEADDEIIVDVGDGDEAPPIPPGVPAVMVGIPGAPLERLDLDTVVMDFANRDDTQEQTVSSLGVDEAPIPDVPAGFDVLEEPRRPVAAPGPGLPVEAGPRGPELAPAAPNPEPPVALPRPIPTGLPTRGPAVLAPPAPPPSIPPTLVPADAAPLTRLPDPPVVRSPEVLPESRPAVPVQRSRPAPVGPPSPQVLPDFDGAPSARAHDVFEDEVEPQRGNTGLWLAALLLGLAAVIAGGWWVVSSRGGETPEKPVASAELPAPPVETPPAEAAVAPPVAPAVETPAAPPVEAPVAAAPVAAPPAPPPEAKPVKAPETRTTKPPEARTEAKPTEKPPEAKPSSKKLVSEAWKAVDAGDFQKAHGLFDRAFESTNSATALYGRGYANEKLGDKVSAADDYCHALAVGGLDVDMTREVEGGLRRVGRTCN